MGSKSFKSGHKALQFNLVLKDEYEFTQKANLIHINFLAEEDIFYNSIISISYFGTHMTWKHIINIIVSSKSQIKAEGIRPSFHH